LGVDGQGGGITPPLQLTERVASVVPLVPAWRVDRTFDYLIPEDLAPKIAAGTLVRIPFGHRRVRGIVVDADAARPADVELETIAGVVIDTPLAAPPLDELLDWIALRYATPRGRVFDRIVPPRVRVKKTEIEPAPETSGPSRLENYEGGAALLSAISGGGTGAWVLRPLPTESPGELIADLVSAAAQSGDGAALVLVPEVRYGSDVLDAISKRFPGIQRVDSAQPDPERANAWVAGARGAPVLAGGRGAILVPAPELRLVVVDEEHHRTYKEDRAPRFDARRVALERARLQGAVCVLVSETPILESGWAAAEGRFGSVTPHRPDEKAARPVVQLVDDTERPITHDLHRAVAETLTRGERAALLVPMSGYARSLWCSACHRSLRCPRCEAGMTYARETARVSCPRCELEREAPDTCPYCGATDFRYVGAGSERLEEQLKRVFPRASVRRMDPRTLEAQDRPPDLSDADIYVTTWIGTKPAIRPSVKTVGVLDADALIRRPDFRSAENAYQALSEMASWAGPASEGGRLVVQTSEPGHHAVQAVVRGDYGFFLEREVEHRRELDYPPFTDLIKARAFGPDMHPLIDRASEVATAAGGEVLGPSPISDGDERALEILVKCRDALPVAEALRGILPEVSRGSRLRVDVDPR
jgi:primosomal protein N' (replication factor Y)